MSVENIEKILQREITMRSRNRFYLVSFFIAALIVFASVLSIM